MNRAECVFGGATQNDCICFCFDGVCLFACVRDHIFTKSQKELWDAGDVAPSGINCLLILHFHLCIIYPSNSAKNAATTGVVNT